MTPMNNGVKMNTYKNMIKNICLFILLCSNLVFTQSKISTEILSVRDGLSSNNIQGIIQDQYGYMWFATADGLNRYDGYQITIFKNIPGDSTSLPTNNTRNLLEDSQGTIWIGTKQGLVRFNRIHNNFTTYKISELNGTWDNSIQSIFEDSRKKLWLLTSDGAIEFERKSGKLLRYDIMKTDNSIVPYTGWAGTINENYSGELYNVCDEHDLLKFDYDASLFVQIPLKNNFIKKNRYDIYSSIVFDQHNNLWFGSAEGLSKIDLKEKMGYDFTPFRKRPVVNRFLDNNVKDLFIDREQNMWISTGRNGVYLFNSKKKEFQQIISSSNNINWGGRFYEDSSGILWSGTSRGVLKYDFDRKPFEIYSLADDTEDNSNRFVRTFSKGVSNKNQLLLGTSQGLSLFNKTDNVIIQIPPKLNILNTRRINSIVESHSGTVWIATDLDGLYSLNLQSGNLNNYKNKTYDNSTLISNRIRSLALDKNENLWVGTRSGLQMRKAGENYFISVPSQFNRKYNPKLSSFLKNLRQNQKLLSDIVKVGDFADLTKEFVVRKNTKGLIYSLGEGNSGMWDYGWLESEQGDTLWNASEFNESFHASGALKNRAKMGLLELKAGRYKLRYISDDSHSMQDFNSLPPQDSTYWGVQIFSLSDNEYNNMKDLLAESENKTYLAGYDIKVLFHDSKNNMWVGTKNGFSKIDSSFHIQNYSNNSTDNGTLSNNEINDINEDLFGNIWIATDNGLNRFDPVNKTFSFVYERDGLPSSKLSAIEVDNQGNLWVSGLKGISNIELNEKGEKQIVTNYDVKDGLQGYEFINNSSFQDESGKLYFSGFDGFNAFYPGSSNKTPPFLTVQDIKISNASISSIEEFNLVDINLLSELELTHNQNDLSFDFASIHYSRPDKNRIMYKMDGVDDEWQIGDRRFASYINMSPGDYIFSIRGSNGDGIWNENTRKINIHIASTWHSNWIAYSVYLALFFGLLFLLRRFELSRQNKNAEIKESHLRAESAELQAKAAEAQAQVIQAENERKTKELEEARQLQLSMLPKDLPNLPNLDIAVYMQTATEVGGDYYDFHVGIDGTLTVVIGDATGHGMKAGTMVTTTKSMFNMLAANSDILSTFSEMTRVIKGMKFTQLSMCLTLLKIKGEQLFISSAAMPPALIYRKKNRAIEEIFMKGMPLGSMNNFPYDVKESHLESGDIILLVSDGLPELTNDKSEMYGYDRTKTEFHLVGEKEPEEIVDHFKNSASQWVDGKDPDDDVTFVVLKVK